MNLLEKKSKIIDRVSNIGAVKAIGQTSDINEIPEPGKGDIDLFVFCDEIPSEAERFTAYEPHKALFSECRMTTSEGGHWGTTDMLMVDGVEIYFMYFTVAHMSCYIADVLAGKHPDRDGAFYPVGRLATILTINVLADEAGTLAAMKEMVREYPEALSKVLFDHHVGRIIDEEDFGRAVSRKDVLFYHMVLEESLDHFLQALYALNKTYFPSRKRTQQYMAGFKHIPRNCHERMLHIVEDGSRGEDIARSYEQWLKLVEDLKRIAQRQLYNNATGEDENEGRNI